MKGVIFDFNGTLFLDHDKHVKAWNQISLELRNRPVTQEELVLHMNGKPNVQIIRYLNNGKIDPAREEQLSQRKEALYRQYCAEDQASFHLIEGSEALFDELTRRGIPFTICSASIWENIEFFVRSFHLDRWIREENIIYDDGTYVNKIAMFERSAEILGLPLEELTILEDSVAGINSAIESGCQDVRLLDSSHIASQMAGRKQIRQVVHSMKEIRIDLPIEAIPSEKEND